MIFLRSALVFASIIIAASAHADDCDGAQARWSLAGASVHMANDNVANLDDPLAGHVMVHCAAKAFELSVRTDSKYPSKEFYYRMAELAAASIKTDAAPLRDEIASCVGVATLQPKLPKVHRELAAGSIECAIAPKGKGSVRFAIHLRKP